MKRVICFDIETTGFEYMRGDRVIEIGAVEKFRFNPTGANRHHFDIFLFEFHV